MWRQVGYFIFALLISNVLTAQEPRVPEELRVNGNCTTSMLKSWETVHDSAQGAVANAVQSAEIGSPAALRFFLVANWRPLLPRRQVMCAKVFTRKANIFEEPNLNPFNSGNDWDFYFIPQPPFDAIFEDAVAMMPDPAKSGVWSCQNDQTQEGGQPRNCMEAEVWPEGSLEAWLKSDAFSSSLPNGSLACAYGPLVTDSAHGGRPEVHPLEAFWWQSSLTGGWTFIQVQDSSRRFDKKLNFEGNPFPQDWEPWSTPRFDEMRVAIDLPLHQPAPLSLDVDQDPSLTENAQPTEDPHPGQQDIYTYPSTSTTALIVNEGPHQVANAISTDFCRDDSQQRLVGYLTLKATVGGRNGFGYQVTYVTKHGTPRPQALLKRPVASRFELLPESIEVKETPGGLQIHGDVQIKMSRLAGTPGLHALSKQAGREISLGAAAPAQTQSESTYVFRNVDLLKLDEFQLAGTTYKRSGRALYPIVKAGKKTAAAESQPPTELLSAFLGVPVPREITLKPERLEAQALSVTPRYVLEREGEIEPEDGTFILDFLNQNLDAMMKSPTPSAKLSLDTPQFEGTDCGTQRHIDCTHGVRVNVVQVRPSNAHPDIRVVYTPTDANPAQVEIYWPSFTPDHLYKLKVTVHYTGPNADQSKPYSAEYWSIDIPVKDASPAQVEAVVTTVAQFAGLDPASLALPPFDDSDPVYAANNSRYRRAAMLRMAVAMFSSDATAIAPEQLKVLVDAARALASGTSQ